MGRLQLENELPLVWCSTERAGSAEWRPVTTVKVSELVIVFYYTRRQPVAAAMKAYAAGCQQWGMP